MASALIPDPSLGTESLHPAHAELDRYATDALVAAFAQDQAQAAAAVQAALPALARAVDEAAPRLASGGRLIYTGAGTSGRLGVLDSVELLPTFSWPTERAIQPDFVAWEAPSRFLVGYGMDVGGGMRGLPYIGAMD